MRYSKYIKYFIYLFITILLMFFTLYKQNLYKDDIFIAFLLNVFISISTGLIVYISTAIHLEKIEFYKSEGEIISIYPEMQKYRNLISEWNQNRKDLDAEKTLTQLKEFRDYCNSIISLFSKAGMVNSRTGICENISNIILYKLLLKHIVKCEQIWRDLYFSIDNLSQIEHFDTKIVLNAMTMETVKRLDVFLRKYMYLLVASTTVILKSTKEFPSQKFIYKCIRKDRLFGKNLNFDEISSLSLYKQEIQLMYADSKKIVVRQEEKLNAIEARTTYRYVLSDKSMYEQLLLKCINEEYYGSNLDNQYSSLEEKELLNQCIKDLKKNKCIRMKKYGIHSIFYITDKGRRLLKKREKFVEKGKKMRIDIRNEKDIKYNELFMYEELETMHIKLN